MSSADGRRTAGRRVHVALLAVQIIFGVWPVVATVIMDRVPPAALIGFRTLLGAPLFFLVARERRLPSLRDLGALTLLAIVGISANQLLFAEGLLRAGPVNASVLGLCTPALTLLVAVLLRRERATGTRIAGVGLSLLGAALLVPGDRFDTSGAHLTGNLLILASAVCYASYLVLARDLLTRLGSLRTLAWLFLLGAVTALPWTAGPLLAVDWSHLPAKHVAGLAFVLLLPTLAAYVLNAYALKRVESSLVAVYIYTQPLVAALTSRLWLGTPIPLRTALAGGIIAAGVALSAGVLPAFGKRAP